MVAEEKGVFRFYVRARTKEGEKTGERERKRKRETRRRAKISFFPLIGTRVREVFIPRNWIHVHTRASFAIKAAGTTRCPISASFPPRLATIPLPSPLEPSLSLSPLSVSAFRETFLSLSLHRRFKQPDRKVAPSTATVVTRVAVAGEGEIGKYAAGRRPTRGNSAHRFARRVSPSLFTDPRIYRLQRGSRSLDEGRSAAKRARW